MEIDGKDYRFIVFSDVSDRDGLGVEVSIELSSETRTVCEVFRSDVDGTVTFTAFEEDIPLVVVERACRMARERLLGDDELGGR